MTFAAHKPRVNKGNQTRKKPETVKPKPAPETVVGLPDLTALTPETVLYLQGMIGNQAVQRLIAEQPEAGVEGRQAEMPSFIKQQLSPPEHAETKPIPVETSSRDTVPPVQRMSVSEDPIVTGTLVEIFKFSSGSGIAFKLSNDKGENLIVKFIRKNKGSKDDPKKALIGSQIQKIAGVDTPDLRMATPGDRTNILNGIDALKVNETNKDWITAFKRTADDSDAWNMMVMEFAQGKTLAQMEDTPELLTNVLSEPQFQSELGAMLAADAFAGEGDRMHLYKTLDEILFYYNPGNIIIVKGKDGSSHLVAIDNDFNPKPLSEPYGSGEKKPSAAVANEKFLKREVEAIYDALVKVQEEPKKGLWSKVKLFAPKRTKQLEKWKAWKAKRNTFVKNVMKSAQVALGKLLKRGHGWKKKLEKVGLGNLVDDLRFRKRYLRILRTGIKPKEARTIARDKTRYRRWVLTVELKFPEDMADKLLTEYGDEVYKESVRETRITGDPRIAFKI